MIKFSQFMKDESGATAIEYGLIAAIISVGIIAVLGQVRSALQGTFSTIQTSLSK
jgi:pilus assembly protein Flp/PilA